MALRATQKGMKIQRLRPILGLHFHRSASCPLRATQKGMKMVPWGTLLAVRIGVLAEDDRG